MSKYVTTSFVNQFNANLNHLVQQKGSMLRRAVEVVPVNGEKTLQDRIGSTESIRITSRHMATPNVDVPHDRRSLTTFGEVWNAYIDKQDEIKLLVQPTSPYAQSGAWALGRAMDREILRAADAVAYGGKEGNEAVNFDTSMVVDVQVAWPGVSAADYGLNVAKLLEAKKLLMKNNVDKSDTCTAIVNGNQVNSLLKDAKVVSNDYNILRPLVDGEIVRFAGFELIPTEELNQDANNDDKVVFFSKSGLRLGVGQDIQTKIDERPDMNYTTQVWSRADFGAVRMEEAKVGYIECDTSAGPGA